MSQESVELVRRSIDAYSRRDLKMLRLFNAPDLEVDWSASRGANAGVYRGLDEVLRIYVEWFEMFDMIVIEPESFIDIEDSVVVPNIARMRGRDDIEVSARSALLYTVRGRKISRICLYQELDQALKAVGLAE
jgi:ketosteroid isomerase-like protein